MKTLSAASIHQYEKAINNALPHFFSTVELALVSAIKTGHFDMNLTKESFPKKLFVVFGCDVGLCGNFNQSVASLIENDYSNDSSNPVSIIAIGNKIKSLLTDNNLKVSHYLPTPATIHGVNSCIYQILEIINQYHSHQIIACFNKYKSRSSFTAEREELYPFPEKYLTYINSMKWPGNTSPLLPIPAQEVLTHVLQEVFFVKLYYYCVNSLATEHGARLEAMQNAENKLNDNIDNKTMSYHQLHHEVVTEELLDVISGYQVINMNNN